MSTFVISDLHGCFDEFKAMLKLIQFTEYDEMYIVGDVCDRGQQPIPLLQFIMQHKNMHVVMGNHDLWLSTYAYDLIEGKRHPEHLRFMEADFLNWIHYNGGYVTMDQFMDCDFPACYDMQEYMEKLPYYKELDLRGKKYMLVHAGLGPDWRMGLPVCEIPVSDLIWPHIGIDDNPYPDVTMIVGHMPTFLYGSQYNGKILHGKNLLHIDCGCVFGRALGCIRLDDMQEFYIPSTYPYLT